MANKYLYGVMLFHCMILLTGVHFATTSICMHVMRLRGAFTYEHRPLLKVLPVALGSIGSVAFGNLSLAYNSVGFYQLSKLATIPITILAEYIMYERTVSRKIIACIVVLLFGIGLTTSADVTVNLVGTVFSALQVLSTVLAQIFTKSMQVGGLSSLQLLYLSAPLQALGCFIIMPIFDNMDLWNLSSFYADNFSGEYTIPIILLTCTFAVGNNVSNFLIIGKTSPVTFQVIGHFKTCLILTLGFVIFHYIIDAKTVTGILFAMTGVIAYGEVK